jgi:glycerate kinase
VTLLASPASLKGVLGAVEAAAALVEGAAGAGAAAEALPIGDGGGGTAAVLSSSLGGSWHDATVSDPLGRPVTARWLMLPDRAAVVEAAQAIGLARLRPDELDPLRASSRGLGELVRAALDAQPRSLLVCLGDTATVDGGAGLLEVVSGFGIPVRVACDVRNPLLGPRGAAHAFGRQKGASASQVVELEARLSAREELRPFVDVLGAGAAGGLGAALAALGAELVSGAELVLDRIGFRERARAAQLVVTGEGTVDRTTAEGKAPGAALRVCREEGVRCAVFGGQVRERLAGAELHELSGDPRQAREDLVALGERLARTL